MSALLVCCLIVIAAVCWERHRRAKEEKRRAPFVGHWKAWYACVSCRTWLSRNEVYHSRGVCPKCGHRDQSAVSIAKVRTIVTRFVRGTPGGQVREEFRNPEDEAWLKARKP